MRGVKLNFVEPLEPDFDNEQEYKEWQDEENQRHLQIYKDFKDELNAKSFDQIYKENTRKELEDKFEIFKIFMPGNPILDEITKSNVFKNLASKGEKQALVALLKVLAKDSLDLENDLPDRILRVIGISKGILDKQDRRTSRQTIIRKLKEGNPNYFVMNTLIDPYLNQNEIQTIIKGERFKPSKPNLTDAQMEDEVFDAIFRETEDGKINGMFVERKYIDNETLANIEYVARAWDDDKRIRLEFYVRSTQTGEMEHRYAIVNNKTLPALIKMIRTGIVERKDKEDIEISGNEFDMVTRPLVMFRFKEIGLPKIERIEGGGFFPYTLGPKLKELKNKLSWIGYADPDSEWFNYPCFVWSLICISRYENWGDEFEDKILRVSRDLNPENYETLGVKEIREYSKLLECTIRIRKYKDDWVQKHDTDSIGKEGKYEKLAIIAYWNHHFIPVIGCDLKIGKQDFKNTFEFFKYCMQKNENEEYFVKVYYGDYIGERMVSREKLQNEMFPPLHKADFSMREFNKEIVDEFNEKIIYFADFECFINKTRRLEDEFMENMRYSRLFYDYEKTGLNKSTSRNAGFGEHVPFMLCFYGHVLGEPLNIETITPKIKTLEYHFENFEEELIKDYLSRPKEITHDKDGKLKTNITVYFHNLGYDGTFLLNNPLRRIVFSNLVKKGNKKFRFDAFVPFEKKHFTINFKDSLAMLQMSLKNVAKSYGLDEKEIYPYNFPNGTRVVDRLCPLCDLFQEAEVQEGWTNEDEIHFMRNCEKIGCLTKPGMFDLMKYTEYYCKRDVAITCVGFLTFCDSIFQHFHINPLNYLTLPSVAYKLLEKTLTGKNIWEYSGDVKATISKAIYGGRCMSAWNRSHHVTGKICDFDAVSLYPSAIARMYLPTGRPHVIEEWRGPKWPFTKGVIYGPRKLCPLMEMCPEEGKETDKTYVSWFIAEITIYKSKQIPFSNVVWKSSCNDEVEENINRPVTKNDKPVKMFVGAEYLRTLINIDRIEFSVENCYYWTGPREYCHQKLIKEMFQLRADLKRQKNCGQVAVKLLMNSMYGKTIQKDIIKRGQIIEKTHWEEYCKNNFNKIKSAEEFTERVFVTRTKTFAKDYRLSVFGVCCLDMSKKIMNEVMGTAFDKNLKIFYQDTDSIHIFKKDIDILAKEFERKYHRQLIGSNLGQFHSDFELSGASGDVWSTQFICVGKKFYLDCLTDGTVSGYHIRGKGINSECLVRKANELFAGESEPLVRFYLSLLDPENEIKVDSCDGAVRMANSLYGIKSLFKSMKIVRNTSQEPGIISLEEK